MFCGHCGQQLPDGAKFCRYCGSPVSPIPIPEIQEEPILFPVPEEEAVSVLPEEEPVPVPEGEPAPVPEEEPVPVPEEGAVPVPEEAISIPTEEPVPEPVPGETQVFEVGGPGTDGPEPYEAGSVEGTEMLPLQEVPPQEIPEGKRRKKPSPAFIAAAVLLLAAAVAGGIFAFRYFSAQKAYRADLDGAAEALKAGRYGQALEHYRAALERRPDSSEAQEGLDRAMEQALEEAGSYLEEEDFQKAADLLKELAVPAEDSRYERYTDLLAVSAMDPEITDVDAGSFPTVVVTLSCGSEVPESGVTVTENGRTCAVRDLQYEDGALTVSYETEDSGYAAERRDVAVTLARGDFSYRRGESYDTPQFEPASVRLVSTDVSEYPVVRAYFRVEQSGGGTLEGLDKHSFTIRERLQGGEYLSREVREVSPMEDQGLNIDLVADKSSSISATDMAKIKQVMIEFVNSLRYEVGDKAEVLAFDDIVQQMCYYTKDSALLVNGINNMATDGMTAFYDAVYNGVRNASLQGGARCVIAFTDGMDNRSVHNANDVIGYANKSQVPVYIIGVGSAVQNYGELRNIAQSTGGRYWYIDDLYDLQEIFDQVYSEQKELYVVEYVSDPALGQYDVRDIQVRVAGGGCKGEVQATFQPVRSVQGLEHPSRYELVKEPTSWEEADRRCQEMGGHLATITSQAEMDEIIALAEANGAKYVWLGGYTSYDQNGNVFGHWVTGEEFSFQAWSEREPSRIDKDGTPEWYIMLWNVPSLGGWCWNDQRNDPAGVVTSMQPDMCFVCEFES